MAVTLSLYGTARDFLGWALQEKATQFVREIGQADVRTLGSQVEELRKEIGGLKSDNEAMRKATDRLEQKIDLQNQFLKRVLEGR